MIGRGITKIEIVFLAWLIILLFGTVILAYFLTCNDVMKRKKRKRVKSVKSTLKTKFYRNTLHSCGRCLHIPKMLLRVFGWERKMCVSCAKKVADNLSMTLKLPKKKNLKLPVKKKGILGWTRGKKNV